MAVAGSGGQFMDEGPQQGRGRPPAVAGAAGSVPLRPRARAEARPARILKISFPEAIVVSMAAPWPVRTFSPMRSVRSWTMLTKWRRSRPSRSSFQTIRVSPWRRALR